LPDDEAGEVGGGVSAFAGGVITAVRDSALSDAARATPSIRRLGRDFTWQIPWS
jgi:hypothetical protein